MNIAPPSWEVCTSFRTGTLTIMTGEASTSTTTRHPSTPNIDITLDQPIRGESPSRGASPLDDTVHKAVSSPRLTTNPTLERQSNHLSDGELVPAAQLLFADLQRLHNPWGACLSMSHKPPGIQP